MRLLILTVNILNIVLCERIFKSVPVTVKSYENETVLLPCYLQGHEGHLQIRWYKNGTLVGDSDNPSIEADRIKMHSNFSLQIDGLNTNDTVDYVCEVVRADLAPVRQIHSIEVQFPPTIKTIPEDGYLEVRKNEYVDIGCVADGTPAPIIDWTKNGEHFNLLDHRSRIKFKADNRLLAGEYVCVANNGVGDPVTAVIRVVIQDAPIVSTARSFVHTDIGLRAALSANIEFASPPATTYWLKEGRVVHTNDRVLIKVNENIHELIFRSVTTSDLGNYTFRAENKLGMADVSFKLTGVPNTALFKVEPHLNKPTATSFTLVWEVDSYSTIIEYHLWLRPYYGKIEQDSYTTVSINHWRKIVVPGESSDGPIHSASYTIHGLTPATVYEALVTSRNVFGWSKASSVLHFATEPGAYRTKPSTSDYSDVVTPVLEEYENLTQTDKQINTSQTLYVSYCLVLASLLCRI